MDSRTSRTSRSSRKPSEHRANGDEDLQKGQNTFTNLGNASNVTLWPTAASFEPESAEAPYHDSLHRQPTAYSSDQRGAGSEGEISSAHCNPNAHGYELGNVHRSLSRKADNNAERVSASSSTNYWERRGIEPPARNPARASSRPTETKHRKRDIVKRFLRGTAETIEEFNTFVDTTIVYGGSQAKYQAAKAAKAAKGQGPRLGRSNTAWLPDRSTEMTSGLGRSISTQQPYRSSSSRQPDRSYEMNSGLGISNSVEQPQDSSSTQYLGRSSAAGPQKYASTRQQGNFHTTRPVTDSNSQMPNATAHQGRSGEHAKTNSTGYLSPLTTQQRLAFGLSPNPPLRSQRGIKNPRPELEPEPFKTRVGYEARFSKFPTPYAMKDFQEALEIGRHPEVLLHLIKEQWDGVEYSREPDSDFQRLHHLQLYFREEQRLDEYDDVQIRTLEELGRVYDRFEPRFPSISRPPPSN